MKLKCVQVVSRRMLKSSFNDKFEDENGRDKKKVPKRNETMSAKKDMKREKSSTNAQATTPHKGTKGGVKKGGSKGDRVGSPCHHDDEGGASHPLLERVKNVDGELWITGMHRFFLRFIRLLIIYGTMIN